jgi:hypothetical protein
MATATPLIPKKRTWKKWALVSAGCLLVLLAAGYGAYAYYTQTPAYVLKETFVNMSAVKTVEFSGTISGEVSGSGPLGLGNSVAPFDIAGGKVAGLTTYKAQLVFNGRADLADPVDPRSELTMQLEVQGYKTKINTKIVDKALYLKADELPKWGEYDTSKYLATWLKFDYTKMSEFLNQNTSGNTAESNQLSEEKISQLEQVIRDYPFIKLTDRNREELDNIPVYHYKFEVDKEMLKQ